MRRGLFGGTFSPVHAGHLVAMQRFVNAAGLDELFVTVAGDPPHKPDETASAEERLAMTRLALGHLYRVSDDEVRRPGKSYTADTLARLCKEYPRDEWFLGVGSDVAKNLANWVRAKDIFRLAAVVIVPRSEREKATAEEAARTLTDAGARVFVCEPSGADVSSTKVRAALAAGEDTSKLLHPAVAAYIRTKGLYGVTKMFDKDAFLPYLKAHLKPERYIHSLGVMDSAGELAVRYGFDVDKARLAGLLHDAAKNESEEKQRAWLAAAGYGDDEDLLRSPGVWHSFTGAYVAEHELGITDPEVLSMIRWHTSGHGGMTLGEKIIYIADFIEPNREYGDVIDLRKLAFEDINRAALEGAAWSLSRNADRRKPIYHESLSFYNQLLSEVSL